jgi:hypothetical protein
MPAASSRPRRLERRGGVAPALQLSVDPDRRVQSGAATDETSNGELPGERLHEVDTHRARDLRRLNLGELFAGTLICDLICLCEQPLDAGDESPLRTFVQLSYQATPFQDGRPTKRGDRSGRRALPKPHEWHARGVEDRADREDGGRIGDGLSHSAWKPGAASPRRGSDRRRSRNVSPRTRARSPAAPSRRQQGQRARERRAGELERRVLVGEARRCRAPDPRAKRESKHHVRIVAQRLPKAPGRPLSKRGVSPTVSARG